MSDIDIRPTRFLAPISQNLVAAALEDLGARYGGSGDDTPVEAMEFDPPDGGFFVAYLGDDPVGCAGWRSHTDGDGSIVASVVAELKRMYVAPEARGLGVATAMLAAVEQSAARYGRTRMILECGFRQPEAIALYEKLGYSRIPDFGFYRNKPGVRSYGRDLVRITSA